MKNKALDICRTYLSGQWDHITSDELVFRIISGGYSNQLYYCSLPANRPVIADEPREAVLRFYGQHTPGDEYRATDTLVTLLLSERQLGPKLYGVFAGGRLEEFINGRSMTCAELKEPRYLAAIAKKFAKIHTMSVPIDKRPSWLFQTLEQWWQDVINYQPSNADYQEKYPRPELEREMLKFDYPGELQWLKHELISLKSPVVFSHNDLSEGNIMLTTGQSHTGHPIYEDNMVLIDYEYGAYNYRGFDFGNHFAEHPYDYSNPEYPYYYVKYEDYPSDSEKRLFMSEYIKHSEGLWYTRALEDKLVKEADYFTLASHLLWFAWCINKARTSQLAYGYWENSRDRMIAYQKHKQYVLDTYRL